MMRQLYGKALFGAILIGLSVTILPTTVIAEGVRDLDSVVQQIRSDTGGRVLSARTEREDGHNVHNIRILTRDGRVKRFRVPVGNIKPDRKPRRFR